MQAFLDGLPAPGEYAEVFHSPDAAFVPAMHEDIMTGPNQGPILGQLISILFSIGQQL